MPPIRSLKIPDSLAAVGFRERRNFSVGAHGHWPRSAILVAPTPRSHESRAELPAISRPAIVLCDTTRFAGARQVCCNNIRFHTRPAHADGRRRIARSDRDHFFSRHSQPNQSRLNCAAQELPVSVPQVTFWKPRLRQSESHQPQGRTAMLIASLVIAQLTVSAAVLAVISLLDRR